MKIASCAFVVNEDRPVPSWDILLNERTQTTAFCDLVRDVLVKEDGPQGRG